MIFNLNVIFYQNERCVTPTLCIFLCTSPFQFFFWNWTKIVSSLRKHKNLACLVIICRDMGCFMLTLFYLENLMGDFYPPPSVFFCISPLFIFFWTWTEKCVFCQVKKYKNLEVLVICKDMDVVSVDMQPCTDALFGNLHIKQYKQSRKA